VAVTITDACTCCDACLAECPNEAIAEGDLLYTVDPDLCTECVGFSNTMRCVDVCPIDMCIVTGEIVETKEALLEKAKRIHPNDDFSGDVPSHL
jgi:ferredoxin